MEWFSPEGIHIDWYAADASLACFFGAAGPEESTPDRDPPASDGLVVPRHLMLFAHAGSLPRTFHFPQAPALRALRWQTLLNTGRQPPNDIHPAGDGPVIDVEKPLELCERSLVCLVADTKPISPPPLRRIARRRA